jgi:putative membrane protein
VHPPVLPTINASLNASAGVFLILGGIAIKDRNVLRHRKLMISAFCCSALFLCTYLYYHLSSRGISHYQGKGVLRVIYFIVLGTHTPLAVLIVPFIIMAIRHALRGEYEKHTRITRWLYPTWIYVSVTGVVVYLMLYIFPQV